MKKENIFSQTLDRIHSNAKLIVNPSNEELRELARKDETTTEFGSASYISKIRARSTTYTEIVEGEPTEKQLKHLKEAEEYLKGKELIQIDRKMNEELGCRVYVTKDFAKVAFMWKEMLFKPVKKEPDIRVVAIPEFPERHIIIDPDSFTTYALGSDYAGEVKKANLRLAMLYMKKKNGLGLHAGSKVLKLKLNGEVKEKGILLFGLSATGKTTLTCHHHWLNEPEGVAIRQDDVVLLSHNGYCYGTENNFYIKTDNLESEMQPLLYKGATSKNAILENIKVNRDGKVDFADHSITTNGRAVVMRNELDFTDEIINIDKANILIFITRRNTVVPPIAKLNPEQAACFFMLGESVWSSATEVGIPGTTKRVVGTNPFIIGPLYEEGNRFLEIMRNTGAESFLLNTGRIGGNKEKTGEKITIKDSVTMITEAARNSIEWKKDEFWGYEVPVKIPGIDMQRFDMKKYYSDEHYNELNEGLRKERIEWLKQFPELKDEIKNAIRL